MADRQMDATRMQVLAGTGGATAPCICLVDAPEHPTSLEGLAGLLTCNVVTIPVAGWGARLTPWPAPALYRGEEDYAGQAAQTLEWLVAEALPAAEAKAGLSPRARAIAGYSLAGLFSLYAFVHDSRFAAVGCLSGSLWYDGWTEHLEGLAFPVAGRYAFFSLGTKERRGPQPRLKQVQVRTETCVRLLRQRGVRVDLTMNPGGHLSHIDERIRAGLTALDAHLAANLPRLGPLA